MESNTVRITLDQVQIGMICAENIYNSSGLLLVGKNQGITQTHLFRLKLYQIYTIIIYNTSAPKAASPTEDKNSTACLPDSAKYDSNQKYIDFKKQYISTLSKYNVLLQSLIHGEDVAEEIYECFNHLLSVVNNKNELFDYLYNIEYSTYEEAVLVHSLNVAIYCNIFGGWLNLDKTELKELTLAGLLHDIGKFDISNDILNKPGRLSDEEFSIIKQHPSTGFNKFSTSSLSYGIKMAILQHHEKIDGSGYPFGFRDQQIHDFAKIVAIVDIYDAMTSYRTYHKRIPPFCVINILNKDGFTVLDNRYLSIFSENIAALYVQKMVLLSSGETGRIVFINKSLPTRPLVQVGSKIYNLEFEKELNIVDIL